MNGSLGPAWLSVQGSHWNEQPAVSASRAGRCSAAWRGYADLQRSVLIRRAKALLSDETRSIGRIGVELGYADAAHFSRAFLHWAGTTPSDWQARQPYKLKRMINLRFVHPSASVSVVSLDAATCVRTPRQRGACHSELRGTRPGRRGRC
ncbi:helix-turn-helix domain-containing protein [Methylorubrum zatmanii]